MREERSLVGNLSATVRVGDTVRRRAGPWTPAVHALLRYLEGASFEAPRVLGMDEQGREILAYLEGEAHSAPLEPLPDRAFDQDHLLSAARLLRRYHDVVERFQPPPDARWRLVAPTAHELICHNDWSPWNALFRERSLAVMLDWDLAGPGSRLWDVANAAYCWAPLSAESKLFSLAARARRLRLFCDGYGLADRKDVLATIRSRIRYVAGFIEEEARRGDPGFAKLVMWDTPAKMSNDVRYLDAHHDTLERVLA